MTGLTERQLEVLRFIGRQIDDAGYPPTIREIGEALDIRSTNGVNDHLKALERKGYLTRDPVKSRALIPTSAAREVLGEASRPANVISISKATSRPGRRRSADPRAGADRGHGPGGRVPPRDEQEGLRLAGPGRLDDRRRDPAG